jgi:preprotein translocase subunit SecA
VRYVTHLEVVADDEPPAPTRDLRYSAAEDPVGGSSAMRAAAASAPPEIDAAGAGLAAGTATALADVPSDEVANEPVQVDKLPGRNEPCYCGSGKKFKLCHGR